MEEKDNNLTKQIMLEEVITKAVQIPGVKVNRKQFLAEQFASKSDNLEEILDKGPVEAGIKKEDINLLSKKLILTRTSQSSRVFLKTNDLYNGATFQIRTMNPPNTEVIL